MPPGVLAAGSVEYTSQRPLLLGLPALAALRRLPALAALRRLLALAALLAPPAVSEPPAFVKLRAATRTIASPLPVAVMAPVSVRSPANVCASSVPTFAAPSVRSFAFTTDTALALAAESVEMLFATFRSVAFPAPMSNDNAPETG